MKTSNRRKNIFEEIQGTTEEIISQIKKLIKKGNARRVIIKNKRGKIVFQTPLTAGAAGTAVLAVISPLIAAIGFFAVVLTDMKVVVEKYPEAEGSVDSYEVEAEVIEIDDDEEDETSDEKTEKTVGKD